MTVIVVGAGGVGTRKARAFLDAGARVRVIAPEVSAELRTTGHSSLEVLARGFADGDLEGADLAVAATGDAQLNSRIAAACRARHVLCNRADNAADGTFDTLAVHRAGMLAIGVAAGIPGAAIRIRDEIARRFDERYARALDRLAQLRASLLPAGAWTRASETLTAPDFCDSVESGEFPRRAAEWE